MQRLGISCRPETKIIQFKSIVSSLKNADWTMWQPISNKVASLLHLSREDLVKLPGSTLFPEADEAL